MSRDFSSGFEFSAVRSSGPGGQNVNKVSSKVELRFNIYTSNLLSEEEISLLFTNIASKISQDGWIIINSQTERSQLLNKEKCIEKFYKLMEKGLHPKVKRKPPKVSVLAKAIRRKEKERNSESKQRRKKDFNI